MAEAIIEFFLRYDKKTKIYEFKVMSDGKAVGQVVNFEESAVGKMRSMMTNAKEVELFDFLLLEAKKDNEERFVSASNAPVKEGQATLG